jgi:RsiW-degrading membrane proteinase PrsW (M82 family)
MHDTKMLVSWIVILAATGLAYYLGYRAKSPKRHGGVIGTLLLYSFYGFLPLIIMFVIMGTLTEMGIWKSGGDTDIGPALTPLLVSPVYWVSVFIGMGMSKKEQA